MLVGPHTTMLSGQLFKVRMLLCKKGFYTTVFCSHGLISTTDAFGSQQHQQPSLYLWIGLTLLITKCIITLRKITDEANQYCGLPVWVYYYLRGYDNIGV